MSEKSQAAREDAREDLLEQIITQGLDKMKAPAQAADGPAPAQAAPPVSGRNKRSSVYLYLLILFGAAFMMLLLAYFVQQRSSESTISDLRDSMNLSREELLDEIRELEERNGALHDELAALNTDLAQWQGRYEEKDEELTLFWNSYYEMREELYSWNSFWELEQYCRTGDLENCAALLLLQTQGQYRYSSPDAARQEEIAQTLIDAGVLDEEYYLHPEEYEDLLDAYLAGHTVSLLPNGG